MNDAITQRLQASFKTKDDFTIPWQVAAESYAMSAVESQRYEQLAEDCFLFLSAAVDLLRDDALLHRLSPNAENVATMNSALKGSTPPLVMVRPDIVREANGRLSIIEMETMIGGLGMSAALHAAYLVEGYEGVPAVYAQMIRSRAMKSQANPEQLVVGVIVPESKKQYDWEFESLAAHLLPHHITMVTGRPAELRIEAGVVKLGTRQLDCIHRFFRLSELAEDREALRILQQINQKKYIPILQPWVELLEEKALMALLHDSRLETAWIQKLGRASFDRLRQSVPPTYIMGENPDLLRMLYNAPKTERAYWLKRSSNSWGGRQAFLGSTLSNAKWKSVLEQAVIESLRGQVWILQEHREGADETIKCMIDSEIITKNGQKGRFNPFVCLTERGLRCADLRLTARKNHKVHGASDATFVPISLIQAKDSNEL